jgi:hypothetical protein
MTRDAFRLLDDWMIPKDLHPQLLGLPPTARKRETNRYRMGMPLPADGDSYERIALLLRIDAMVRKMFPHSALSACLWVTTQNLRYGSRTPLDTMLELGLEGFHRVEHSLAAPWGW